MSQTSKKRKESKPRSTRENPPGDVGHNRDSSTEPRYVNPIFPRDADRVTRDTEDSETDDPETDDPETEDSETEDGVYTQVSRSNTLSADGHRFAREVKVRDIEGCARYISLHREILKEENTGTKYTQEATSLLIKGDAKSISLAESYVEKGLIVRNCKGGKTKDISDYLGPLARKDKKAWDKFYGDFNAILAALKAKAKERRSSTTSGTAAHGTRLEHGRHANIDDVTKGVSQLGSGHAAGPNYAVIPGYQTGNAPKGNVSRHRRSPSPRMLPRKSSERHDVEESGLIKTETRHSKSRTEGSLGEAVSQTSNASQNRIPSLRGDTFPKAAAAVKNKLDSRFKRRNPGEAGKFFKIGRVFAMLWLTEETSLPDDVSTAKWTMQTNLGTKIFSHIRRFAVVKESHGFVWAVPINTYNGKATTKSGFNTADRNAHAIIYTQGKRPMLLNNEAPLTKRPIEVVPADQDCELERASRINFGKIHTVEHNVTARDMGMVSQGSRAAFTTYWREQNA